MSESIISPKKECVVCHTTKNLHRHHVFYGTANRSKSEQWGCWVWLCGWHHNGSNFGVHKDRDLDYALKKQCQREWERRFGSREEFIKEFGKNYL